ncbi:O-antigen/teichoic acid export membrane protein [Rhodovulum iodosum]|uniref:O-antigen/teichoic acid export membrane protein n=1 Tax=Rhodovulum iodosum TaxID=68291 RepID=A0ABV3XXZ2_9RHOB|nr:oligosaccharide flippase family protein [Rhodovulum robiginosum]RSK38872.1 polysaccharide biosynthesis protein [Rhodovulum robiginosum]
MFAKYRIAGLMPGRNSLGRRVFRAGGWSMVQILSTHTFRLVSNLIMTRLLLPEAFGLMAMVGTVLTAFSLFSEIGIDRSIMRERDGDDPHFLRVAWVVKMGRFAVIAIAVLLAAGALALLAPGLAPPGTVYADPRLPGLIALSALSALSPLMLGGVSTCRDLTLRRLENRRYALVMIASQALSLLCMLGFAQLSPTVWALMAGMLSKSLFVLIASHIFYPGPRMRFEWDAEIARRLWTFGKFLMGSSVFSFLSNHADKLILGSLLGAGTFGLYVIAQIWVMAGRQLINRLSNHVGFPAVSEIMRDRPQDLPRLYRKFQTVIDLFCLGAFLAFFFLGRQMMNFLYTEQYAVAGQYVQLMSIAFLVMRFQTLNGLVMNTGNTRAIMLIAMVRGVAICLTVPLGFHLLGIEGAILAASLNQLLTAPYTLALLRPVLGARQILFDTAWFVAAVAAAALVYLAV